MIIFGVFLIFSSTNNLVYPEIGGLFQDVRISSAVSKNEFAVPLCHFIGHSYFNYYKTRALKGYSNPLLWDWEFDEKCFYCDRKRRKVTKTEWEEE